MKTFFGYLLLGLVIPMCAYGNGYIPLRAQGIGKTYNDFAINPFMTKKARKKMKPYLLSKDHPIKPVLDSIFCNVRVTLDRETFEAAGFTVKYTNSETHLLAATHPLLPGYVVKVHLDDNLLLQDNEPTWLWMVRRCKAIRKIREVIKSKRIKYFVAPRKHIYPLPLEPAPPMDPMYSRKLAVLIVEDMDITSLEQSKKAWKEYITREHLKELYFIISQAKGAGYKPETVVYTRDGKFAFIQTQYPHKKPDYKSIRKFLSREMRVYWDKLVKLGPN